MTGSERIGTEPFDRLTGGDVLRWTAAVVVVALAGTGTALLAQRLPSAPAIASVPEPTILIDLEPAPQIAAAEPIEPESVEPLAAQAVAATDPVEPITPIAAQPLAPDQASEAVDAVATAQLPPVPPTETVDPIKPTESVPDTPTAVAQAPSEEVEETDPETIEPLQPQDTVAETPPPISQAEPELLAEAVPDPAVVEPLPSATVPAEQPPSETVAALPEVPFPTTISPALQRQRETTPPTPRRTQPPRQQTAEPTPKSSPRPRTQQPAATTPAAAAPSTPRPAASSVSPQQWQAQALSQLDRRKVYPPAARQRGEQGAAVISFVVSAAGQVSAIAIAQSSGSDTLDQAALDTARRASPLPPPPAALAGQRLSATIRFSLR